MQPHRSIAQSLAAPVPSPTVPTNTDADANFAAAPVPGRARQSLADTTQVQTSNGLVALGSLSVGQRLMTRAGTLEPITGIERIHFTKRQLQHTPDLAPIRFDPGALPGMEEEGVATLVSPDCIISWSASPLSNGRYPARAFRDGGLIRSVIPEEGITYIQLCFATTLEIRAGGIWVHLAPGEQTILSTACPVQNPDNETRVFRPLRA